MLQNKKNITKKSIILFIVVVIIGLFVMLYPIISSKINYKKSLEKINIYSSSVSKNPKEINNKILEQATKYNEKITGTAIEDSFKEEKEVSGEYLGLLNVNSDGIMGYIKIPKIDVEIPIYHGTDTKTLQKGVGHFEGSSLPVGGKNTHSILSGHRGLPSSKVFADLDKLEENDLFYIYVLNKKLAYKVDQVKIVKPSDTKDLTIVESEDYVTLVTCTPYAINTHRLLVRGKRVKYDEDILNNIEVSKKISVSDIIFFSGLVIAIIIIIFTIKKIAKINSKEEIKNNIEVLETNEINVLENEILENENINEKSYSNETSNDIEVLEDDEEII